MRTPALRILLACTIFAVSYIFIGFFFLAVVAIAQLPGNTGDRHAFDACVEAVFHNPVRAASSATISKTLQILSINGVFWACCLIAPPILLHWFIKGKKRSQTAKN